MGASLKVDLEVRPLVRVGELTHQNLEAGIEKLGQETEADAKQRCPVSATGSNGNPPGFLRDSIHVEREATALTLNVDAFYAAHVEFGTRHAGAQPFATPAVEAARAKLPDLVGEALNRAAQEAGR